MMLPTHAEGTFVKDYFRDQGLYTRPRPRELLFDLATDPLEEHNLAGDPAYQDIQAQLQAELERWQRDTHDPLLEGDIPPPEGARLTPLEAYGRF
jgi:N-sulfoglucosamine sulfohydrolase